MVSDYQTASLLKYLRKSYNYTTQKVAEMVGVSKAAVSKWENGDDITTEHLYDLAKLYNVSFQELYRGKLEKEGNTDYWRRNYVLSNFELETDISKNNIEEIKKFFERCNMVQTRFFEMLPQWAFEKLSDSELEEFNFLKQYFKFDSNYYSRVKYGPLHLSYPSEEDEKNFVQEIIEGNKNIEKECYLWELRKLYDFDYDIKFDEIMESNSLKTIEYLVSSLSQIEKDELLYESLPVEEEKNIESFYGTSKAVVVERDTTNDEIENDPIIKILIKYGANCLHQYKLDEKVWDKKMFDAVEGKIYEINNDIVEKYKSKSIKFSGKIVISILEDWKAFTYQDYLSFIDKDKTDTISDIVNLKDSNPLKYYENLLKRNNIFSN